MDKKFYFRFNPFRRGLSKVLGTREAEIMELLWQEAELSVAQVQQMLGGRRPAAYTTVMTIMKRLWDKGLLRRRMERGAYLYSPVVSREELLSTVARDMVAGLLEELAKPAIAHLFQRAAERNDELLEEMERLIENHRKKRGAEGQRDV